MWTPGARLNSVLIFATVLGFLGLELVAMSLYPGGTWWDRGTRGARFWQNYICDLEWRVALNGVPNPVGARVATWAMLVLTLGLGAFWLAVPHLFQAHPSLGAWVRGLGIASSIGTIAVIAMPSDRFGVLHGTAVIVACIPGLSAAGLAVLGLITSETQPRVAAWIGASMLVVALVDFVLYASHLLAHTEGTPLVPGLEKVALVLLLAWMIVVGVKVGQRP